MVYTVKLVGVQWLHGIGPCEAEVSVQAFDEDQAVDAAVRRIERLYCGTVARPHSNQEHEYQAMA